MLSFFNWNVRRHHRLRNIDILCNVKCARPHKPYCFALFVHYLFHLYSLFILLFGLFSSFFFFFSVVFLFFNFVFIFLLFFFVFVSFHRRGFKVNEKKWRALHLQHKKRVRDAREMEKELGEMRECLVIVSEAIGNLVYAPSMKWSSVDTLIVSNSNNIHLPMERTLSKYKRNTTNPLTTRFSWCWWWGAVRSFQSFTSKLYTCFYNSVYACTCDKVFSHYILVKVIILFCCP